MASLPYSPLNKEIPQTNVNPLWNNYCYEYMYPLRANDCVITIIIFSNLFFFGLLAFIKKILSSYNKLHSFPPSSLGASLVPI